MFLVCFIRNIARHVFVSSFLRCMKRNRIGIKGCASVSTSLRSCLAVHVALASVYVLALVANQCMQGLKSVHVSNVEAPRHCGGRSATMPRHCSLASVELASQRCASIVVVATSCRYFAVPPMCANVQNRGMCFVPPMLGSWWAPVHRV